MDLACDANALIRAAAAKHSLTASQGFHLLSIPFDGCPMSSLAHKLGLDNSTLTRNIQKLEKLDLVKRQVDSYDKRIQRVLLTKKGTFLLGSLEQRLKVESDNIMELIDLDAQEHLVTVLEKLSWALDCIREKP